MDFDALEGALIRCATDLQTVASWVGDITDLDALHVLQVRAATVALLAQSIEDDIVRMRQVAAA